MTIAGTGHRPKYMPGKYDETHEWQKELNLSISWWLKKEKPSLVISGGALGFDLFLARQAYLLNIPFDLYLPFEKQGNKWREKDQARLWQAKTKARRVVFTSWKHHPGVYDIRNHAMMDDADLILALHNPKLGVTGTSKAVDYATKKNKQIINLWK